MHLNAQMYEEEHTPLLDSGEHIYLDAQMLEIIERDEFIHNLD